MSSRAWQVATVATATAAAVPLVCWQYRRYIALKKRREDIKLLRKVELIAAEVAVRVMHLEAQANELVSEEATKEAREENFVATSALNSYYHFDSQGNKLKTKWDSFDADVELKRLENEEREAEGASAAQAATKPVRLAPHLTRSDILAASKGVEHELEAVLSFLDDIRGDKEVKQLRKVLATRVTKEYLPRIDAIQAMLA
ncbi:unnamed protein product [Hyaloperonospora brassicae]|uniref:RxLR effector candidate protein n=1 Tax=Hyaloperonospora brassicae TaxID=162125 RepID=A0AAV0UVE2_HYABA|nr:unnamed protein product [Hyaloperonospora brassicae]